MEIIPIDITTSKEMQEFIKYMETCKKLCDERVDFLLSEGNKFILANMDKPLVREILLQP